MTSDREPLKPIPAEDVAIEEGFAALDASISAFACAVAEAAAAVGEVLSQTADPPATAAVAEVIQPSLTDVDEASPAAEAQDDRPDETDEAIELVGEADNGLSSVEPAAGQVADEVGQEPVLVEPEDEATGAVLGDVIWPTPAEVEEVSAGTPSPEDQHDEAVLASLDEETAKAIRVMRRLSPDRKRVNELLEEYRATQAAREAAPQQKKKSWWTRG